MAKTDREIRGSSWTDISNTVCHCDCVAYPCARRDVCWSSSYLIDLVNRTRDERRHARLSRRPSDCEEPFRKHAKIFALFARIIVMRRRRVNEPHAALIISELSQSYNTFAIMRLLPLSALALAASPAYAYLDTSPFFMFSTSE